MKYYQVSGLLTFLLLSGFLNSCSDTNHLESGDPADMTWAEKLGYPAGKKVIILHADDAGMCEEANIATFNYLQNSQIQSAAGMPPCEWFDEFAAWAIEHPEKDLGLHLTLTSEWQTYRWGPVASPESVPTLIDQDGFLWHEVPDVVQHATVEEVEKEVRAQIEKAISLGMKIDHIDTHMGTLYGKMSYAMAFVKIAQEYNIPAMVIDFQNEEVVRRFSEQGYPIDKETYKLFSDYKLPKLDDFYAVIDGNSYEEKLQIFYQMVKSIKPGLTEIIFHPSVETDNLKTITNSWQQRVWESEMFSDPAVKQFFQDEGIVFTNWIEIMERHKANSQ